MRLIAAVLLIFTIAGCTTTGQGQRPTEPIPKSARPTYNLAGYSPAFKDGYIDGCETAKQSSYAAKDERRFSSDNQYRMGWNDGFSVCRGKQ
ncbi:MAG: hypothetical protein L0H15_04885 [Nitrosospira sp.]|nr:hypothetical protein [Nitrosospira sp.]